MCTYLNWPKAIKCTQCQRKRSASPSDLANGTNSVNNTVGTGIASMVNENTTFPLTTFTPWTNSSSNNHHLTNESTTNTSAIVHHRSMSNSPSHGGNNANHCSLSESTGRIGNVGNVSDNNKNLNYKNSITGGTRCKLSTTTSNYGSRNDAPRNTTKSPPAMAIAMANPIRATSADDRSYSSAGGFLNQNHNSSPAPNSLSLKWSCAACTYDNWPQSTKCVMCYTPRIAASAIIVDNDEVPYETRSIDSHTHDQQFINCDNLNLNLSGSGQVLADDCEYVDDTGIDDDIEDDFAIGTSKSTGKFTRPKTESHSNVSLNSKSAATTITKNSPLQQVPVPLVSKNCAAAAGRKFNLKAPGLTSNTAKPITNNVSISNDSKNKPAMAKVVTSSSSNALLTTSVDIVSSRIGQLNLRESANVLEDAPSVHNFTSSATNLDVTVNTSSSSTTSQESISNELPTPATAATASINASSTSKNM